MPLSNKCDIHSFMIRMASFWLLSLLTISLMIFFPLFASSSQLESPSSSTTISTSPSLLTDHQSPPRSTFQELSPDIAPLLPSPGGVLTSPTSSSMPTIPSNPSPPNPDDLNSSGSDTAFSPTGSLPVASANPKLVNIAVVAAFSAFGLMQLFIK